MTTVGEMHINALRSEFHHALAYAYTIERREKAEQ